MFKKNLLILCFIILPGFLFSQITPDSLIGTYAGEYWFKWEEDTTWTISNDTVFIVEINQNCAMTMTLMYFHPWLGGTWIAYETSYDFCYGNSYNLFYRFHSDDSLTIFYEGVSMPPPNYHVSSTRWYGTKISDSILVQVNEVKSDIQQSKIFPNPVSHKLYIQTSSNQSYGLQIFDMFGNEIINQSIANTKLKSISTEGLVPGVYILRLHFENMIQSFKIIKV